jgi:hypothetical protein
MGAKYAKTTNPQPVLKFDKTKLNPQDMEAKFIFIRTPSLHDPHRQLDVETECMEGHTWRFRHNPLKDQALPADTPELVGPVYEEEVVIEPDTNGRMKVTGSDWTDLRNRSIDFMRYWHDFNKARYVEDPSAYPF